MYHPCCAKLRFTTSDAFGVSGGVEYGFMSCSTDRDIALFYSNQGYLFEMQTGMISRGASLSWLSFYPEEAEICLPPCTALDRRSISRMDQGAIVVQLNAVCQSPLGTRASIL